MVAGIGFETVVASPSDYERLVAEIYYNGKFVALVSQEKEVGNFEIEFPDPNVTQNEIVRKVALEGFQQAVEVACRRLRGE